VVEYEHSIKTAVMKLRQALDDDADTPRYVENLPRRGYRFIYPVNGVEAGRGVAPQPTPAPPIKPANVPPSSPADFTHSDLIGRTVSHYRILERLGGGGMGIVYKAEDTRLGRKVALKFLPTGLARNPMALARFQREARAASALNHPHICTVYEVDAVEGRPFLAMELMEGQTLKDLLAGASISDRRIGGQRPPLQLDTLLDLAIEIAEALEAAHAGGIVHRDIKPANVFVTKRGEAKILDFGLAKFQGSGMGGQGPGNQPTPEDSPRSLGGEGGEPSEAGEGVPPQDTPTLSLDHVDLTIPGTTVGTAAYMSPEQARCEKLDARTDLFSFGAVLYEMATGRQAFSGATSAELREAILTHQPTPPQRLNPAINPRLQAIIEKALEKDRDVRYQHASEIRADLKRLKRDTDSGRAVVAAISDRRTAVGTPPLQKHRGLAIALPSAAVLVTAILAYWLTRPPVPPRQLKERRLTFNPSETAVLQADISPDGKYLDYSDQRGLHLELIQTGEILNIPPPEGPTTARNDWWANAWFPDGTKFVAAGFESGHPVSAWVFSVLGGPPRKIRDAASPWAISPDGALIAFGTGNGFFRYREIWLMGPEGEEPRRLVSGSEDDCFYWAAWSPTGQRIAYERFHRTPNKMECSIESRDLKGGQPTLMLSDPGLCDFVEGFHWFPDGRFIYSMLEPPPNENDRNLWEIRVDTRTGQAVSKPKRITNWTGVYLMGFGMTQDGKQMAVTKRSDETDVYVGELEASGHGLKQPRRLTLDEHNDYPGGWMPDNKTVLFWAKIYLTTPFKLGKLFPLWNRRSAHFKKQSSSSQIQSTAGSTLSPAAGPMALPVRPAGARR